MVTTSDQWLVVVAVMTGEGLIKFENSGLKEILHHKISKNVSFWVNSYYYIPYFCLCVILYKRYYDTMINVKYFQPSTSLSFHMGISYTF